MFKSQLIRWLIETGVLQVGHERLKDKMAKGKNMLQT